MVGISYHLRGERLEMQAEIKVPNDPIEGPYMVLSLDIPGKSRLDIFLSLDQAIRLANHLYATIQAHDAKEMQKGGN